MAKNFKVEMNQRRINDFLHDNAGQVQPMLRDLAGRIEARATQNAPQDSGALRNSGSVRGPQHVAAKARGSRIIFGVEHAQAVETGTEDTDAQEYMRPAIEDVLRPYNLVWTS